jgi:hypothetical protein
LEEVPLEEMGMVVGWRACRGDQVLGVVVVFPKALDDGTPDWIRTISPRDDLDTDLEEWKQESQVADEPPISGIFVFGSSMIGEKPLGSG